MSTFLGTDFPPGLLIPILALAIPIVAVVTNALSKVARDRERHETIRELARAGQPIPPELLADPTENDWPNSSRREPSSFTGPQRVLIPAVINLAVGVGLCGMFYFMMPGSWLWSIGLIPGCLGLGLLMIYFIQQKHLDRQSASNTPGQ
ncbi:MAG TPA: DUF6249 domain-containing protein [Burkholderiaceae bacterium]|jgi:hypothetical protein